MEQSATSTALHSSCGFSVIYVERSTLCFQNVIVYLSAISVPYLSINYGGSLSNSCFQGSNRQYEEWNVLTALVLLVWPDLTNSNQKSWQRMCVSKLFLLLGCPTSCVANPCVVGLLTVRMDSRHFTDNRHSVTSCHPKSVWRHDMVRDYAVFAAFCFYVLPFNLLYVYGCLACVYVCCSMCIQQL